MAITLLVAACGGGDGDDASTAALQSAEPSGLVGAAGGTVSSQSGDLRLEIPAGALAEETLIEVVEVPAESLGADSAAVSGPVYDLLPDGLTFLAPVTVVRSFDAAALSLDAGEVPFLIVLHEQPESWALLESTTMRTGNVVAVSAEIDHFTGNAVIDFEVIGPFDDEVRLTMTPDEFTAEKGSGAQVALTTDVPSLIHRGVVDVIVSWRLGSILKGDMSDTGGMVICDGVGEGSYRARLQLKINQDDAAEEINMLIWVLGDAQFTEVDLQVLAFATCTDSSGEAGSDTGGDETSDAGLGGVDSFAGDLTFDAIEGDLTYTDPFTLEVVPNDSPLLPGPSEVGIAASVRALVGDFPDQTHRDIERFLEGTVVLSQLRPGGEDQRSYGVAASMTDGSHQLFTAGLGDTHLELYILDVELCPGFPIECDDLFVDGWNFGLSPDEELDQALQAAWDFVNVERNTAPLIPDNFLWAFDVNGEFSAAVDPGGDDLDASGSDSQITRLASGLFEGERWIKLELGQPIPGPDEQFSKQYSVLIRSDQDDLFGASWTVRQGQDPFASSFCLQDRPNCPTDGIVPVLGVPGATAEDITFFFADDAFGNATGLEISASVQTGLTDAAEDVTTDDFRDGARFPWIEIEEDPC